MQIGSNRYTNTGVRDLEIASFKANSTWINDIGSKDLSNRPVYVVLNTHYLDMILQLKYMPIVRNPVRIASSDWKSWKCYGLWYALSSKRVRWPPIFFYVFNLILSFSTCSQSFKKICTWELLGANVLNRVFAVESTLFLPARNFWLWPTWEIHSSILVCLCRDCGKSINLPTTKEDDWKILMKLDRYQNL